MWVHPHLFWECRLQWFQDRIKPYLWANLSNQRNHIWKAQRFYPHRPLSHLPELLSKKHSIDFHKYRSFSAIPNSLRTWPEPSNIVNSHFKSRKDSKISRKHKAFGSNLHKLCKSLFRWVNCGKNWYFSFFDLNWWSHLRG